jgi:hypothetical protein
MRNSADPVCTLTTWFGLTSTPNPGQFPKFVAGRIAYGQRFQQEKTKHQKAKSPWWNACPVAMKARGNRIGSITDLKTSCIVSLNANRNQRAVEALGKILLQNMDL